MAAADPGAREGIVVAVGVLVLSAVFAWRQWAERRVRDETLSEEDADYFGRRDSRRWAGTGCLALTGAGMLAGSLIEPTKPNRWAFLGVWLAVLLLVGASLVLAMLDWGANRRYALRVRKLLAEERRAILADEVRRQIAARNANGDGRHAT